MLDDTEKDDVGEVPIRGVLVQLLDLNDTVLVSQPLFCCYVITGPLWLWLYRGASVSTTIGTAVMLLIGAEMEASVIFAIGPMVGTPVTGGDVDGRASHSSSPKI